MWFAYRSSWKTEDSVKILITGGAGYIGTQLCYALDKIKSVEKVLIYDNLYRGCKNLFISNYKFSRAETYFLKNDILDSYTLKKVIMDVDVVVHLAAKVLSHFSDPDPHVVEQVNHWGTAEVVHAVENSNVKRFIYLSSASVYGVSEEELDEQYEPAPLTSYGISKRNGEKQVQRLFSRMPTYILRCGNIYGFSPSMRFDTVVNKLMFDANFTGKISIHGNGNQHRPIIHEGRVVTLLLKLLQTELPGGIYNVVDENISINRIGETISSIYPDIEKLYINRNIAMRDVKIKSNDDIDALIETPQRSLQELLVDFKKRFSFSR